MPMTRAVFRARRRIQSIINTATHERDTTGYRENLGYDQQNKLQEYLNTLDLTYPEFCLFMGEFYRACDAI